MTESVSAGLSIDRCSILYKAKNSITSYKRYTHWNWILIRSLVDAASFPLEWLMAPSVVSLRRGFLLHVTHIGVSMIWPRYHIGSENSNLKLIFRFRRVTEHLFYILLIALWLKIDCSVERSINKSFCVCICVCVFVRVCVI